MCWSVSRPQGRRSRRRRHRPPPRRRPPPHCHCCRARAWGGDPSVPNPRLDGRCRVSSGGGDGAGSRSWNFRSRRSPSSSAEVCWVSGSDVGESAGLDARLEEGSEPSAAAEGGNPYFDPDPDLISPVILRIQLHCITAR